MTRTRTPEQCRAIVLAALRPEDRLKMSPYLSRPPNVAYLVHLLNIALVASIDRRKSMKCRWVTPALKKIDADIRKIKAEITRLDRACERAIRCL
jgi:hypothetical protein